MNEFFSDTQLVSRKTSVIRRMPDIPETGWRPPTHFPNLDAAVAISVDCETFDPDLLTKGPGWARKVGHIVGVSIGAIDRQGNIGQWYFPVRHEVEREHNFDERHVFPWLKTILENSKDKVGTNLLYDVGWLTEENIYVNGTLHDVQFAEALLDEEASVALETLGYKYCGQGKESSLLYQWCSEAYGGNANSTQRANIYRSPPRLVGYYAESDASLPLRVIQKQFPILQAEELTEVYRLECDLIPLLVRMRMEGVRVDLAATERLYDELHFDIGKLFGRIEHEFGYRIHGTSSAQLGKLFDHMGMPYSKTKAGNPSFTKEFLANMHHPVANLINSIREMEKIRSTFLRGYIMNMNVGGKIYPQFHPLKGDENGTLVGRFSSSLPNLQNIPSRTELGKRVRQAFVPDEGHIAWRKHDYSQIHYRLLAHFAVDKGDGSADALRARYCDDPNTDYHDDVLVKVAPLLGWDIADSKVKKMKRRPIKNVNFGLLYGQSPPSLAYKSGFTPEQAKEFFAAYHAGAPYVKPTMAAIEAEVHEFGFVRTLLGRRVRFKLWEPKERSYAPGRPAPLPLHYEQAIRTYGMHIRLAYGYRGVNYKLQGSEPDVMKTGMRLLDRSGVFDVTGVPRLTVHDELDFSKRDHSKQTQEAFAFIQHTMENALTLRVPINVDATEGSNWGLSD